MKKIVYQMMLVASMATLTACSSDDPFESTNNNGFTPGGTDMGGGTGGNGSSTAGSGELLSFSVDIDREAKQFAAAGSAAAITTRAATHIGAAWGETVVVGAFERVVRRTGCQCSH